MLVRAISAASRIRARRFHQNYGTRLQASIAGLLLASLTPSLCASEPAVSDDAPNFGKEVRPILSDHCFACHGPDEEKRHADLRLDTADGIESVIDAQDAAAGELISRILSDDPDAVMPPPDYNKPLSDLQKRILRDWVASGAEFKQHWAFVPASGSVPGTKNQKITSAQQIDSFLNQSLSQIGLQPNGDADKHTLLRRVCLDLTGLPPSRDQMDAFLSDTSPNAYENLVDRLLATKEYGQHVGRYWLDLVRYADTHGLHLDNYREMWPYRDWVINAFNANMPFDEFVTKQLAGDLLPDATRDDRIASGFNRLNVTTSEGGSIYDEVFARNCMDRTDAFGTIFLGLTTGCAVCHDHKFDPISQHDYYSLLAYFNSIDGRALDNNAKDHAPAMTVPSDKQKKELDQLQQSLVGLEEELVQPIPTVDQAQQAWEQSLLDGKESRTHVLRATQVSSEAKVELKVNDDGSFAVTGQTAAKDTVTLVAPLPAGVQWQTLQLEALVDKPEDRVGLSENGNVVLSEFSIEVKDAGSADQWAEVPIAHVLADYEQAGKDFEVGFAVDGKVDDAKGWAVGGHEKAGPRTAWFLVPSLLSQSENAEVRIRLSYQSKYAKHQFRRVRLSLRDSAPNVPADQQIKIGELHSAGPFPVENPNAAQSRAFASMKGAFKRDEVFQYEGRQFRWQHRGDLHQVDVNDLPVHEKRSSGLVLHQLIQTPQAKSIDLLLDCDGGHVIFLNGKEVGKVKGPHKLDPLSREYKLDLKKGDNDLFMKIVHHEGPSRLTYAFRSPAIEVPERLKALVEVPRDVRSEHVKASLQQYYRKVYCLHPDLLALIDLEKGTRKAVERLKEKIPTTLIWKELAQPRQAHILKRGQYDQPGDPVDRSTPAFLPPFPNHAPNNRLGLSRWLTSPEHPLTARVAVNRFWQQVFGIGLVKTSEDFGSQGDPPSHPELLDWLSVDFQRHGWDVKRLLKSLVMTDAYRRGAKTNDAMLEVDPNNRLFARGPRHRLDAEVLRDQALALSGLLVGSEGGPSVKPPQPAGLWKAVGYSGSNTVQFKADEGDKVYRRSVYMFWKRTSAPPQMSTFDAPSRESCTARRERTNTPLQALLLMNEVQYLEASAALAQRALTEPDVDSDPKRLSWLFELVTTRVPLAQEQRELMTLLDDLTHYYDQNPELAAKMVSSSDSRKAAWTVLSSTLLNLDEVVSK